MKKKLLALVCALVMIFSLASCGLSTPDTVGKVGDFEVSSGLYLLAQFSAYQQAAQLAGTDQDATDVKAFLKETITTDADSGETAVVQDYVADKTLETLRTFAAIDARFAELGGELTAEQTQVADNYAQQLMDQYGSTYTANGIGLETLKAFERIQLKHTLLLTLVYGPDGESPVDDSDLTEHLDSQMYELAYVNIPLYNTSTFVSASDDQKAQMLQLAQAAAASCSETQDGSVSEQVSALHSAASAALPDIYAVLDSTPAEDASNVQTELLTESDLTGAFTQDGAADAVRGLVYGEAAAVQYNAASIILMMRPAAGVHAGRPAHPDPERHEGRRAGRCPHRLRQHTGERPQHLCHEQDARQQDREPVLFQQQLICPQTHKGPASTPGSGAFFGAVFWSGAYAPRSRSSFRISRMCCRVSTVRRSSSSPSSVRRRA